MKEDIPNLNDILERYAAHSLVGPTATQQQQLLHAATINLHGYFGHYHPFLPDSLK
jgi:hypothetical protein